MANPGPESSQPPHTPADQPTMVTPTPGFDPALTQPHVPSSTSAASGPETQMTKVAAAAAPTWATQLTVAPQAPSALNQTKLTNFQVDTAEQPTQIASPSSTSRGTQLGQTWGDFRFDRLLGKGGMGAVYLGRQVSLDRPVAIKVLPPHLSQNEQFRARFQVEARAVARLSHQNVVQVYAYSSHDGNDYFAMEFVEGEDLSQKIKSGFQPSPKQAIGLMIQAVRGLVAAGTQGIIHRDIKPGNMMIAKSDGTLKLMDFGLAKLASEGHSLTMTGTVMGTVSYFSPEQGRGLACDQRTDLYAIGVVLYELVCRRLPFTGTDATSVIYQHIHSEPTPPRQVEPGISEDLELVILTCLRKNQEQRYQSAEDLLADLEALHQGQPAAKARTLAASIGHRVSRSKKPWVIAGGIGVAAAIAVGAMLALRSDPVSTDKTNPIELASVSATQSSTGTAVPVTTVPVTTVPITAAVVTPHDPVNPNDPGSVTKVAVIPVVDVPPAADLSGPIRAAIAAGEWSKAESLISSARASGVDGKWDDLDRQRRRTQAADLVSKARSYLDQNNTDVAAPLLAKAQELDASATGIEPALVLLREIRQNKSEQAASLAEINAAIARDDIDEANRALGRNLARFGNSAEATKAKEMIQQRQASQVNTNKQRLREQIAGILTDAQQAITRKDWDTAVRKCAEATALDARDERIIEPAKTAAAGVERTRTLSSAVTAAVAGRNLVEAEKALDQLQDHAPGSNQSVSAAGAIISLRTSLRDDAAAVAARDAKLGESARRLATRLADLSVPVATLTTELDGWAAGEGAGRAELTDLRQRLDERRLRADAVEVMGKVDKAVVAGNAAELRALIDDRAWVESLCGLANFRGLVFVSRVDRVTLAADGVSGQSEVAIRHSLDIYPERTLRYRLDLARSGEAWRVAKAALIP